MSTTYIRILSLAIVSIANAIGFDLDHGFVTEFLSILLVAAISVYELIQRYKTGGITWFGKRQ